MLLRLQNDATVLSVWFSADAKIWHKYPQGFEISVVRHTTVYDFQFVRLGSFDGADAQEEATDFDLRNHDSCDVSLAFTDSIAYAIQLLFSIAIDFEDCRQIYPE